jgi:hypothetical protein
MPNYLVNSPADVVRKLLIDLALCTSPALSQPWPVFAANEPDTPDNCVTVYDSPDSWSDGRDMNSGEPMVQHSVQVRVRSVDHPTGWTKADLIRRTLAEGVYLRQVLISPKAYLMQCLTRFSAVMALGAESPTSKRRIFVINMAATLVALN